MRTFGFILFVVVTAGVAVSSTLVASRYLALERQLTEAQSHLEQTQSERKRQEEDKMALCLESQRIQVDLEARLAEQKNQLDDCAVQRQRDMQEILNSIGGINKRLTDILVSAAPSAKTEARPRDDGTAAAGEAGKPGESGKPAIPGEFLRPGQSSQADHSGKPGTSGDPEKAESPARAVDVPKGAILTPEQEARKLQKAE